LVVGDEGEGESSCIAVPQRSTKVCFIKTILKVRLDPSPYYLESALMKYMDQVRAKYR
jgi:hypothetical protein